MLQFATVAKAAKDTGLPECQVVALVPTVRVLTVASFFASIGGFDLGAQRAGFTVTHHSEIDKNCVKLLASRFPDAQQLGSVTDVPRVTADIICGGFPCQDLSVAGRRSGLDGERSGLFYEIARVIEHSKPRWFVLENVPGLLSSGGGRDMAIVLGTLEKLGYGVVYRVLDSQYFGVPQRRRRVFIIGHFGDGRAAQVLFEPDSLFRHSPPKRAPGEVAPTLFASGAGTSRTASAGSESEFCIVQIVDGQYIVRRLTPTECERLQGFPDGWTAGFADATRYKMLGNAVTVNVAEWIFKRIAAVESAN